jgi:hypothetical protein
MRKLRAILFVLVLCVTAIALPDARNFNRKCSVTGGSAQQLSAVLATCGYTGTTSATWLTIKNPSTAANSLFVGQSDVDGSNGYEVEPGASSSRPSTNPADPVDLSQIYLFVSSTQNAYFSVRTR